MKNAPSASSEEELLQLRNDGKISEPEYQDLRAAIQKSAPREPDGPQLQVERSWSKRKFGKTAFVLMLIGLVLPSVCYLGVEMMARASDGNAHAAIGPWFFLGVTLEIAAFVSGILAWPDVLGKATVITVSVIVVLALLFIS